MFNGPAFVRPARAGLKGNPSRSVRWPFRLDGGGDCGPFGQPLKICADRHAQTRQHGQIPIHGMCVERWAADGDVVKSPRTFADFVEADEEFSIGEPCERAAAREALEVNDPVEILRPHPADAAKHFRPVTRRRPAPAFKADDAGQIAVAFEERRELRINPPKNFARRQMAFEQAQHGQRLHHVAERTGFENQDFQKASVAGISQDDHMQALIVFPWCSAVVPRCADHAGRRRPRRGRTP